MESLADTPWDVTISGTGLAQSLLALALSRSGKNVLHVDKNPYYGGPEAAFSLQEAEEWVNRVNNETGDHSFEDASVWRGDGSSEGGTQLSASRAYTLSLSPQLIYARSQLIPTLVSSKVHRQLEFQAVGSWWIHRPGDSGDKRLYRVPGSREDIFADDMLSVKSKRTLMRFIRHIGQTQQSSDEAEGEGSSLEEEVGDVSLTEYLTSKFKVPDELHTPLLSLCLSQASPQQTSAQYAVSRIKRHLTSLGVYGSGFGSLTVKWGGGSEISQVGCRALAVGGGVYVLNTGIKSLSHLAEDSNGEGARIQLSLSNEEVIKTKFVVGSNWDLPTSARSSCDCDRVARSISVVSSSLGSLFPTTAEGGPVPVGAVVAFPGAALGQADDSPPVYILVHSSETGECPTGQCVLYGSVSISGSDGQALIESAVQQLLESAAGPDAKVLWSLRYTQLGRAIGSETGSVQSVNLADRIVRLPPSSLDLAFDDSLIDTVKDAWQAIMGDDAIDHEFMTFEDREGAYEE
ncbi:putative Rab geranylgeranyl transferase escort protein [Aspergillus homomorphus CBS 101889]|uniref:Rab proteins geranylgeranyltransferase n=1 Tax=Aspergillus homomorphus (strain CBS 101889) TaxID=1450537 RepID=A0A395HVX1_ASPHC|nr:rab geranylgeranyl transferase escort protein [Aspergillus homomorphus CBS 101889]RAL10988.1 rab geranylgeranyl transferase escort protein [Aspergillus homomorphus CBS 101889]